MAVDSHDPSVCYLLCEEQQQQQRQIPVDGTLLGRLPQMYSARPACHSVNDVRPSMVLRRITEGFLNLEQQMKMWCRHLYRKLGNLESRLSRCESMLLPLLQKKAPEPQPAVVEAPTPTSHDIYDGVEDEFKRLHRTVTALREKAAECCRDGQSFFSPERQGGKGKGEPAGKHVMCDEDDDAVSIEGGMFVSHYEHVGVSKGMSPTADTTAVGSGESVGLTPDGGTDMPSARLFLGETTVDGDWRHVDEMQPREESSCLYKLQNQSSFQLTPSFSTITPVSEQKCFAMDSTCRHDWSPFIHEPCRVEKGIIRGGKPATTDKTPTNVPDLRMGSTATRTQEKCCEIHESPCLQASSLERKLIYSPETPKRMQGQVSPASSDVAGAASLSTKTGREIPLSNADSVEHLHNLAEPVLSSKPVTNGQKWPDATPSSQQGGTFGDAFASTVAGVPASSPLYILPQQIHRSSGDSCDCSSEWENAEDKEEKISEGGNEEVLSAVAPSMPTVGTVWQRVVSLAHAEQYYDQLTRLHDPPLSMLSSDTLEISESTVQET
ncbi:hypothetical protein MOQ_003833 [Trypanosoma cruzi marinkellei]|uniref:Uncharacterized protein n=1 Tax=Trypanosoma cruzi marinkellei TaxID=85056 RepID=K2MZ07_TRYCR|nr:hypothetical protein MOQ_003833 [Trypanosoma cruzi marinkellei]